jgi:uncharacterized protein YjbJ (UPF0337 family)
MESDTLKGQWKQVRGMAKQEWGRLTDDDLQVVEGDRDRLVGRVQERYGIEKAEAERQVDDFLKRH